MEEIEIPVNASSLGTLVCDTRYYYTVIEGLRSVIPNPYLATGKAIHRYAELATRGIAELEILQSVITLPAVETDNVMLAANGYNSSGLLPVARINGEPAVEINFDIPYERFEYGGKGYTIRFQGTIDRIDDDGNWLDIVDFKSSRRKRLDDIEASYANCIQFPFYFWIAKTFARQIFPAAIAERIEDGQFSFRTCVVMLAAGGKWLYGQRQTMTEEKFARFDQHLLYAVNKIKLIWTSRRHTMSGYVLNQCPGCTFAGICHANDTYESESAMKGFERVKYAPLTW